MALELAVVFAALSGVVLVCDALIRARAALQRRRRRREGVFGVVVDRDGRTLGVYLDPFGTLARRSRLHRGDSPWTTTDPEGRETWAWEGFGVTEPEARAAANRLRRSHLPILPRLDEDEDEVLRGFRSA
ncbi:MAG: hypothetical protein M3409_06150 [Gemmatimonadota bacterium]|nr:hypothetical protein [Gemmatimonadota bacterium]